MITKRTPLQCAAACLLMLSLSGCGPDGASGTPDNTVESGSFRLQMYSRTESFRHASIPSGIRAIEALGAENDFTVDATEDATRFSADGLAPYDVIIFLNTTLNVLPESEQRAALRDFVLDGGGFVGVHSAADSLYDWPFYESLVGAYFLAHPLLNQSGNLEVEDDTHPSTAHLPAPWTLPLEEYYSFVSNPRGDVRVLLRIEESSYQHAPNTRCDPRGETFPDGFSGFMGDHPMSWCHDTFAGRAWYTALGHSAQLYDLPEFRAQLLGGILTAARRVPANCSINAKPAGVPDYQAPELENCSNQLLP